MCRTGTLRKLKVNLDKRIKIRNLDVLTPAGEKFRLRWKEYQILSLLVARSPELVTRTEIIENIWKGTYCSDSTINQTIKSIRQKISDTDIRLSEPFPVWVTRWKIKRLFTLYPRMRATLMMIY
ncbi:TPA: transcriptional regulator [Serratia marcescens]